MPKCSSSYTTSAALRHMYSIASWSPSQSEPLIVSYMCHSQLSSDMLPSDAPMPPCAATVCERVGNTFDSTATDKPASASCSDARIPAPPAPTMTASKRITGRLFVKAPRPSWTGLPGRTTLRRPPAAIREGRRSPASPGRLAGASHRPPQHLDRPAHVRDQHADDDRLQREAHSGGLHVIHRDIANADPCVEGERNHEQERGELERVAREQALPDRIIDAAVPDHNAQYQQRIERHDDGGHALREPVAPAVVRARRFVRDVVHQRRTATIAVNKTETTNTNAAERRAGARSTPTCKSTARWRNPASR